MAGTAGPGPNPEVSMVIRPEEAGCPILADELVRSARLDKGWELRFHYSENKHFTSSSPKKCCQNDSKPTANRHQSDSTLLTPAYPDAILESERVHSGLCAGASTPAEPPGVNGL